MKIIITLAATAAVGIVVTLGATAPSHAAGCYYKAVRLDGRVLEQIRGYATQAKLSWACNIARRECNRRLDRAYRRGELPRGVVCRKAA